MRALVVIVLGLSFIAAATAADFLDDDKSAQPTEPVDNTTKKIHKVTVNKTETIKDDMGSKYRSSTLVPIDIETTAKAANVTTEIPITTQSVETSSTTPAPKVKTTTNAVPIDDHTTTETAQTSTSKSSNVTPVHQSRYMRWVLGGLFGGIFVVILSLYAYKFYQSRSDSTYQNL